MRVISIDDSGWGFPIGGVLIGVHDSETNRIWHKEINVSYFKEPKFSEHAYLGEAARVAWEMVSSIPNLNLAIDIRFDVCRGYVNEEIARMLSNNGLKVRRVKIGEPLQGWLEYQHKIYIREITKSDLYYDPKEIAKIKIPGKFYAAIKWAQDNNRLDAVKTGWKYFNL